MIGAQGIDQAGDVELYGMGAFIADGEQSVSGLNVGEGGGHGVITYPARGQRKKKAGPTGPNFSIQVCSENPIESRAKKPWNSAADLTYNNRSVNGWFRNVVITALLRFRSSTTNNSPRLIAPEISASIGAGLLPIRAT